MDTGIRLAVINVAFAVCSCPAREARAVVAVTSICAVSIQTRLRCALININVTIVASPAGLTYTPIAIHTVLTRTILTWI